MTTGEKTVSGGPRERVGAHGALWASAFAITALILVQAGRGLGNQARAELVSSSGDFTILTASGGTDEACVVLDGRNQVLMVYRAARPDAVTLDSRVDVSELFTSARARGG